MPKKGTENSLGLNDRLLPVWESLVSSAETRNLSTRQELENVYNEIWERNDTELSKAIKELGRDDEDAQESVLTHVKSFLVRMMNTPVYKISFRKINYQESFFEEKDDNGNPIKGSSYPGTSILGIGILENTKSGVKYTPRFVQATAYGESAKKLKAVEGNDITTIYASGEKDPGKGTFIKMKVDARAGDAEAMKEPVEIPTMKEYIKDKFDITPVSKAEQRLSANPNDWRFLQGIITFGPLFPRGKKWAKFEVTDVSITIDDSDTKGSAANVQVFADRDLVLATGCGVGSKVQILGSISKSKDPKYNNVAMWWPKIIIPKFKVPIAEKYKPKVDQGGTDEGEKTNDYLAQRLAEEVGKEVAVTPAVTETEVAVTTVTGTVTPGEPKLVSEVVEEIKTGEETVETLYDMNRGLEECTQFGKYNSKDDDCQSCEQDPEYKRLVKDCKTHSESN